MIREKISEILVNRGLTVEEATDQILEVVRGIVPKEQNERGGTFADVAMALGHNALRTEILKALEGK